MHENGRFLSLTPYDELFFSCVAVCLFKEKFRRQGIMCWSGDICVVVVILTGAHCTHHMSGRVSGSWQLPSDPPRPHPKRCGVRLSPKYRHILKLLALRMSAKIKSVYSL
jgi:hypothetical protein